MRIILRTANIGDSQFFFDLRTLPQYEEFFYAKKPISFSQHSQWFQARIESMRHFYMVAELNEQLMGYVRFEPLCFPDVFEIGFILHPDFLGKGFASEMLVKAISLLDILIGGRKPLIFASVLKSNHASLRVLYKVGFSQVLCEDLNSFGKQLIVRPKSVLLYFRY